MLKKDITYVNPLTEQQVTETHYFHLPKAELIEMEMAEHGQKYTAKDGTEYTGMQAHLQRIVEAEDGTAVLKEFKEILRRAYGKKDGDRFVRGDEIWSEFQGTEAYSEFVFDLFTKSDEMANFISAVFPGNLDAIAKEVAARAEAEQASTNGDAPTPPEASIPGSGDWVVKRRPVIDAATSENPVALTQDDITLITAPELQAGLANGRFKLS